MGKRRSWTEEEVALLREAYSSDDGIIASKLLNRSDRAIESKARRLGLISIHSGSVWADREISALKEYYQSEGGEVSKKLPGRSTKAIFAKANELGLKSNRSLIGRFIDETGNRYGKLTALEKAEAPTDRTEAFWLCRCNCGKLKIVLGSKLRQGRATSCGCQWSHYPETLMKKYIRNARKRGISWRLSVPQFGTLIESECHYCGKVSSYMHGDHAWNGIDRVDNSKGYIPENVVPCCGICNKMKSDLEVSEFLEHCRRVTDFQTGVEYW